MDSERRNSVTWVSADLGINPKCITLSTSFADDIGSDSLDIVEMVMELESEFGLTLSERKAANIKTVRDVILWIQRHRPGGG